MRKQDLFLSCLKRTADVYRRGTFNRWQAVAFMASCIDIQMRRVPSDPKTSPEIRDAGAVPVLKLKAPLTAKDEVLQELYAEATTFWAEGYGVLKLVK